MAPVLAQGAMAPSRRLRVLSGTTSSASNFSSVPRPSQVGQAPKGLLKEKSRGSISSMVKPETGQAKRSEKMIRSWVSFLLLLALSLRSLRLGKRLVGKLGNGQAVSQLQRGFE